MDSNNRAELVRLLADGLRRCTPVKVQHADRDAADLLAWLESQGMTITVSADLPNSGMSERDVVRIVRETFASMRLGSMPDLRPISFDLKGAMEYTGLSKTALHDLLRAEKITARKEGVKNLFLRESLDRYISGLPAHGQQ